MKSGELDHPKKIALQLPPENTPCNIHAAITMCFAASGGKPACIYAHSNRTWQQSMASIMQCSHYTAILLCEVLLCDVSLIGVLLCDVLLRDVFLFDTLSSDVLLCDVLLCDVFLCDVLLCDVLLCDVLWCDVML